MEMLHDAINWFEIPVNDFERAKAFYSKIYDFDMPEMMMGGQRMGFFLFDRPNGGIGGAIVHGEGYNPSKDGAKIYLKAGNDLNDVLRRVTAAGGKILQAKTEVGPGLGHIGQIEDTEGNAIFIHSQN